MARTIVVTGAASGIGEAAAQRLTSKGHKVIGVDLRGADVNVDLGTAGGRADLVEQVRARAPDGIDGVLASAGTSDYKHPRQVLAVNYFGAVASLEGLRPQMRGPGARGVAIASSAVLVTNDAVAELEELALAGNEEAALNLAEKGGSLVGYPASKRALTRWVRRASQRPEWAGEGKLLNVVAPGIIETPMIERAWAVPEQAEVIRKNSPIAVKGYAKAPEVAELLDFLLNYENHYLVGQLINIDGGTEVIKRTDQL